MAGILSPSYLMYIGVIFAILKVISEAVIYFDKRNKYTILISNVDQRGQYDSWFEVVGYIVRNEKLIGKSKDTTTKFKNVLYNSKVVDPNKLNLSLADGAEVVLTKDNFTATISLSKDDQKVKNSCIVIVNFLITCKSQEHMQAFLQYLTIVKKEIDDANIVKSSSIHSYSSNENWRMSTLNVVKTFDNVFLPVTTQARITNAIDKFINNETLYIQYGIPRKLGFLLYGIPGTGKSSTIFTIATYCNRPIYSLNLRMSNEEFTESLFDIQKESIVVVEDIDCLSVTHEREDTQDVPLEVSDNTKGQSKGQTKETPENKLTLDTILTLLDGYTHLNECIVIVTTNHYEKLDKALIRPGRIDHHIRFDYIDQDTFDKMMSYYYPNEYNKIAVPKITTAELINTIMLPNLDDYETTISKIKELCQ